MQAKAASVRQTISSRDSLVEAIEYLDPFMKTYPYPWIVDCQEQTEAADKERRRAWPLDTAQESCFFPAFRRASYIPGTSVTK
mmetsp:Transcript_1280/g.1647  ORF Transcript_1280/g.1647 Transcript_1280/m.1647 type:complete len:83 (+) Transcript_1280:1117-1365(+)